MNFYLLVAVMGNSSEFSSRVSYMLNSKLLFGEVDCNFLLV